MQNIDHPADGNLPHPKNIRNKYRWTECVGKKFGRLTPIQFNPKGEKRGPSFKVLCDCGVVKEVNASNLASGKTQSCGCLRVEIATTSNTTHGLYFSQKREYKSWCHMKDRVFKQGHPKWHRYGGRGITICDRWMDFGKFFEDMGPKPNGTTIDRIDNDGNYEPGNCRWATPIEQGSNTSQNRFIFVDAVEMTIAEACRITGRTHCFFYRRFSKSNEFSSNGFHFKQSSKPGLFLQPKEQHRNHQGLPLK